MSTSVTQAVIRRDRNTVLAGLSAVIAVTALYTISMAQSMTNPMAVMHHGAHSEQSFTALFIMWTVMQIAMMSPTAVPMVLMHAKIERHRHPQREPYLATTIFFLGYIIIWTLFSAVFAALQIILASVSLLTPMMASANPWLAGGILIAAGLFQFSSLKDACLSQCRSPVTYLMTEWREGWFGALMMGLKHGIHCVGCCWVLMALLFVAGVMNLLWMAVITGFILIEKLVPKGDLFGRIGGIGFIIWGTFILLSTVL